MNLPTSALVKSLRSCVCPSCGRAKQSFKTFCGSCYHNVSREGKAALYRRVGNGYEAAVANAMRELGVLVPVWPKGVTTVNGIATGVTEDSRDERIRHQYDERATGQLSSGETGGAA